MKHARKLASLLLALVMVFALATTAFATETEGTTTTPTGSITVNNPQNETTYTAYKIFDVVYDSNDHYSYTIDDTSPWFETVKAYADGANSGLTLTKVGATDTYVVTTTDTFSAPEFAAALKNGLTETIKGTPLTVGTGNKPTATGLALGYYFVTSSTGALCSLDTTNPDVTIYDKNDMPFEKEVNTPSADVGQPVTFTITGEVPEHTAFTTYTYEITDTMSKGLTFKKDTLKVKIGSQDVNAGADTYTLADPADSDSFTFKLTIKVKNYPVGDNIVVTYDATVNDKAIAEISKNNAVLKYSNNPNTNELGESVPQVETVYTSKIVIDKYEKGAADTKLEGAEFVLCREAPHNDAQYAALYAVQNDNQNAIQYYKWDKNTKTVSWVYDIADATKVTTDADGKAFFEGLADGTYRLVETKAPAGYNRMTEAQKVVVNGGTALSVTAEVENQAGTLLPSTGGVGTTVFYVLGAVLVLGAVVLLVTKKRMSDANR